MEGKHRLERTRVNLKKMRGKVGNSGIKLKEKRHRARRPGYKLNLMRYTVQKLRTNTVCN